MQGGEEGFILHSLIRSLIHSFRVSEREGIYEYKYINWTGRERYINIYIPEVTKRDICMY